MDDINLVTLITCQTLVIGGLLYFALLAGRITSHLGFGQISGQILAGMLLGPGVNHLLDHVIDRYPELKDLMPAVLPMQNIHELAAHTFSFFLPVYIGVVLFALTEEWQLERLRAHWKQSLANFVLQTLLTSLLVATGLHLIGISWPLAIIAGLLAAGTSPAAVFFSANAHQVEGRFRTIWAQSVTLEALCELAIIGVVFYCYAPEVFNSTLSFKNISQWSLALLCLSVAAFWFMRTGAKVSALSYTARQAAKEKDAKLSSILERDGLPSTSLVIVVITVVATTTGIALGLGMPFMLPVIIAGMLCANYYSHSVFDSLKVVDVMPMLHLGFFALLGMQLDFTLFAQPGVLLFTGVYLILRTIGKLGGSYVACRYISGDLKLATHLPCVFLPNLGATGVAFLTIYHGVKEGPLQPLGEFIPSLLPALILAELVGAPLVTHSVRRWREQLRKEKEELAAQDQSTLQRREVYHISLDSLFQDRVIIDVEIRTKEDAIRMLCGELLKQGSISEVQATINLVLEREKQFSTGIGDEVALPHCRSADIDYPMAVAAFIQDGDSVEWDAPDGLGVRYVFLIVSPLADPAMHIEAMKTVTSHVARPGFLDGLRQAVKDGRTTDYLRNPPAPTL